MPSNTTLTFNQVTGSSYPVDIISGHDSISTIAGVLDEFEAQRALVICGRNTLNSGVVERVTKALGSRCVGTFTGVGQHVPADTMSEAALLGREVEPDILISVGGGSAHDTSKALALLLAEGGDIHAHERLGGPGSTAERQEAAPRVPIVAVPTTLACAEISPGGGGTVTDRALGRKFFFEGTSGRRVVIVDGKALASTPTRILVSTAMSQFRVAVECICSSSHSVIGDALALHGIALLMKYVPHCPSRDLDVLVSAKVAACLPSLARFHAPNSGALSTAICHQAGGLFDVPHGDVHAIMLPHMMRFNLSVTAHPQSLIAATMGVDTAGMSPELAGLAAADKVTEFCRTLGIPTTLRELGIPYEGLKLIADATLQYEPSLATNPRPIVGLEPILKVLQEAW